MSISATESTICIAPSQLGNPEFKAVHRVKYAYVAGSMYRGIASKELVIAMAKAGMIGFLGTGGMNLNEIDANIKMIQSELDPDFSYGMNLLHHLHSPIVEMNTVELYLQRHIKRIEASAFMKITPALALFRLRGLTRSSNGAIECNHHIFAKVSRPEVARAFMSPVPANIINDLLAAGAITSEQAELGTQVPVAHDLCLEADSGGHTDQGVAFALMPAIQSLKNEIQR
ncbi:hypothetical protein EBR96_05650, partial [bacterium]|nr:hypothetical protein [bacterium]